MSNTYKWIVVITVSLSWGMLIPAVRAEVPIDFTNYASCTFTMASEDKDFRFSSYECTGVTQSNLENKNFDNMSMLDDQRQLEFPPNDN